MYDIRKSFENYQTNNKIISSNIVKMNGSQWAVFSCGIHLKQNSNKFHPTDIWVLFHINKHVHIFPLSTLVHKAIFWLKRPHVTINIYHRNLFCSLHFPKKMFLAMKNYSRVVVFSRGDYMHKKSRPHFNNASFSESDRQSKGLDLLFAWFVSIFFL